MTLHGLSHIRPGDTRLALAWKNGESRCEPRGPQRLVTSVLSVDYRRDGQIVELGGAVEGPEADLTRRVACIRSR